jgi:outer membrane murein-binding lipoprotein Lpp
MPDRLVVKRQAPGRARWMLAAAVVLGVVALWGLFEWGRKTGGYDRFEAARQKTELRAEIDRLEVDNRELARQLAILETAAKVEQQAYDEVSSELDDLQSQIAELQKELAFYRGIMAPGDGRTGLQIQALQLFANGGGGRYQMKLVLFQAGPQTKRVQGSVDVALLGPRQGAAEPRRVPLAEVASDAAEMRYSFRYFQVLERDFVLPDGFDPAEVEVNIKPSSKEDPVVAAFPWRPEQS